MITDGRGQGGGVDGNGAVAVELKPKIEHGGDIAVRVRLVAGGHQALEAVGQVAQGGMGQGAEGLGILVVGALGLDLLHGVVIGGDEILDPGLDLVLVAGNRDRGGAGVLQGHGHAGDGVGKGVLLALVAHPVHGELGVERSAACALLLGHGQVGQFNDHGNPSVLAGGIGDHRQPVRRAGITVINHAGRDSGIVGIIVDQVHEAGEGGVGGHGDGNRVAAPHLIGHHLVRRGQGIVGELGGDHHPVGLAGAAGGGGNFQIMVARGIGVVTGRHISGAAVDIVGGGIDGIDNIGQGHAGSDIDADAGGRIRGPVGDDQGVIGGDIIARVRNGRG